MLYCEPSPTVMRRIVVPGGQKPDEEERHVGVLVSCEQETEKRPQPQYSVWP